MTSDEKGRLAAATRHIDELESQVQDCRVDLDSAALEGDRARASDAEIRDLCRPHGDESTPDLVRSTIAQLKTEIEDWKSGSEIEAREADRGRRRVAQLTRSEAKRMDESIRKVRMKLWRDAFVAHTTSRPSALRMCDARSWANAAVDGFDDLFKQSDGTRFKP